MYLQVTDERVGAVAIDVARSRGIFTTLSYMLSMFRDVTVALGMIFYKDETWIGEFQGLGHDFAPTETLFE